jgi:hypothetical protein
MDAEAAAILADFELYYEDLSFKKYSRRKA